MGIPYGGGDDGDGGWRGGYYAEEAFSALPQYWQEDPYVQNMYFELMASDTWSGAKEWHDYLQDYISDRFDEQFDDWFDWEDWRNSYAEQ